MTTTEGNTTWITMEWNTIESIADKMLEVNPMLMDRCELVITLKDLFDYGMAAFMYDSRSKFEEHVRALFGETVFGKQPTVFVSAYELAVDRWPNDNIVKTHIDDMVKILKG